MIRFLLVLELIQSSFGATYYVDFAGGSDAANGTASGTPFQHCPGDALATGTSAATTFTAGDTVTFKGAVEYKSTVVLNFSGTAGSVITYDGNSAGSFGTGKAILNGENVNTDARRYGFYASTTRSNLTFKNFEAKLFGGHAVQTFVCGDSANAYTVRGWGIYIYAGSNITVRDSYFHDIGDFLNATNMNGNFFEGVGVGLYGTTASSSFTVTNCEFTGQGWDSDSKPYLSE